MEVLYWQCHWFTFQSWKKWSQPTITNYDCNRKLLDIQKRQLILSICKTLRVSGVHRNKLSTHLFFKDSQLKEINYRPLWFSVTRGTKQTEWPVQRHNDPRPQMIPKLDREWSRTANDPQISLLQLAITSYKIRHAEGQAHYYSRTGPLKQRDLNQ